MRLCLPFFFRHHRPTTIHPAPIPTRDHTERAPRQSSAGVHTETRIKMKEYDAIDSRTAAPGSMANIYHQFKAAGPLGEQQTIQLSNDPYPIRVQATFNADAIRATQAITFDNPISLETPALAGQPPYRDFNTALILIPKAKPREDELREDEPATPIMHDIITGKEFIELQARFHPPATEDSLAIKSLTNVTLTPDTIRVLQFDTHTDTFKLSALPDIAKREISARHQPTITRPILPPLPRPQRSGNVASEILSQLTTPVLMSGPRPEPRPRPHALDHILEQVQRIMIQHALTPQRNPGHGESPRTGWEFDTQLAYRPPSDT